MQGIADVHSHILPGIDDGSADVTESMALLRESYRQGVRHMVATPHFYPRYDSPEKFLQKRAEAAERLREAMAQEEDLPEITLGAEVYFFPGISESELVKVLTIGEKKCILIEMPNSPWKESHYRELEGIYSKQGITPIVAHVDRYIRPFHTHGIPETLAKLPVLVQANSSFFLEKGTRGMALRMLKKGQIHLLGSDCHNLRSRRPNLEAAVQVIEGKSGREALAHIRYYQQLLLEQETAAV